jgi:hypothetical protein
MDSLTFLQNINSNIISVLNLVLLGRLLLGHLTGLDDR